MVSVGSIVATPQRPSDLSVVTRVQPVAKGPGGTLAVVEARSLGGCDGECSGAPPPPDAVRGEFGAPGPVDPALLLDVQGGPDEVRRGHPANAANPGDLTAAERRIVERLRQRDAAVRQEEEAHAAAAGQFAGAPQYTYVTGPDGQSYAVSGHVDIRAVNHSGRPEDAERALNVLRNAALAPNAPSAQDLIAARGFAASAGRIADAARAYGAAAGAEESRPALNLVG